MKETYKLLKDTPSIKAGTICQVGLTNGKNNHIVYYYSDKFAIRICLVSEITDKWFAPYLFTTEDGKDIYKKDKYWAVVLKDYDNEMIFKNNILNSGEIIDSVVNENVLNGYWKMFSSKEAAQKYIDENTYKDGDWVIAGYNYYREQYLIKYHEDDGNISCYCFTGLSNISKGEWHTNGLFTKIIRKATNEEVETYLIAVAKNKGFKEGVKVKCVVVDEVEMLNTGKFDYDIVGDCLKATFNNPNGSNTCLYTDGTWATIIKDVPEYVEYRDKIYKVKEWTQSTWCKLENDTKLVSFKELVKPSTKEKYDAQFKSLPNITTKVDEDKVVVTITDGKFISYVLGDNAVEIKYTHD